MAKNLSEKINMVCGAKIMQPTFSVGCTVNYSDELINEPTAINVRLQNGFHRVLKRVDYSALLLAERLDQHDF